MCCCKKNIKFILVKSTRECTQKGERKRISSREMKTLKEKLFEVKVNIILKYPIKSDEKSQFINNKKRNGYARMKMNLKKNKRKRNTP